MRFTESTCFCFRKGNSMRLLCWTAGRFGHGTASSSGGMVYRLIGRFRRRQCSRVNVARGASSWRERNWKEPSTIASRLICRSVVRLERRRI